MSSKIKKLIISLVVVVLVVIGVLVGFTVISNFSTVTVFDLKFIEPYEEEIEQIFSKEVYLTSSKNGGNSFEVELYSNASSLVDYSVSSSDPSVATIEKVEGSTNIYSVKYFKEGKVKISARPADTDEIRDSFDLVVRENIPTRFCIPVSEENSLIEGENEVRVYADDKDYRFKFDATMGTVDSSINYDSLYVVDDYNHNIFNSVSIDSETGELVINARQSRTGIRELITIQARKDGKDGTTLGTYEVEVDVRGNYVCDIQLVLSQVSNFDNAKYIYGGRDESPINEGEERIDKDLGVVFTREVNVVYARARIVYTNGDMLDVTDSQLFGWTSDVSGDLPVEKVSSDYGNYLIITYSRFDQGFITITFSYNYIGLDPVSFVFYSRDSSDTSVGSSYSNFLNNIYVKYVNSETGEYYFEYVYWDTRYMREDTVTVDGKIVKFTGGDPQCREVEYDPPEEEGEEGEEGSEGEGQEESGGSSSQTGRS